MTSAQQAAVARLERGEDAAADLDALFAEVGRSQMPLYRARVELLHANGGRELYVVLPGVVGDLLPKFEKSAPPRLVVGPRNSARPSPKCAPCVCVCVRAPPHKCPPPPAFHRDAAEGGFGYLLWHRGGRGGVHWHGQRLTTPRKVPRKCSSSLIGCKENLHKLI